MSQVSKYPVHEDVKKRVFEVFKEAISHLSNSTDIEEFLEDFLSPVEKIMLAKRISIAVLLGKGYSYSSVAKILRVTPSTIAAVNLNFKYSGKGYKRIVEKILTSEKREEFWQKIDDILTDIIPPGTKGSNWSYLRGEREKEKRNKRKAF